MKLYSDQNAQLQEEIQRVQSDMVSCEDRRRSQMDDDNIMM